MKIVKKVYVYDLVSCFSSYALRLLLRGHRFDLRPRKGWKEGGGGMDREGNLYV